MMAPSSLILVLLIVNSATALQEPRVNLVGNKEYLNIRNPTDRSLNCNYTLASGEEVREISWIFDREIASSWFATGNIEVGERLKGKISVENKTPDLEFVALSMDIAGMYSCKVTTSLGETLQSEDYQLVVIDVSDAGYLAESTVEDCEVKVSWSIPAILPKPKPRCGVWQDPHGYTGTTVATSWQAVPYYNGSIAYHLDKEAFKIVEMALDAVIKCEVGIEKYDKSFVTIKEEIFNHTKISERGCSILEVGDNVKLTYANNMTSCRYEMLPKDPSKNVMAILRCPEGTVPSYRGGKLSEVQLYCSQAQWTLVQGYTWDDFDSFRCKDASVVVAETQNFENKETKILTPDTSAQPSNSDTNNSHSVTQASLQVWCILFSCQLIYIMSSVL